MTRRCAVVENRSPSQGSSVDFVVLGDKRLKDEYSDEAELETKES